MCRWRSANQRLPDPSVIELWLPKPPTSTLQLPLQPSIRHPHIPAGRSIPTPARPVYTMIARPASSNKMLLGVTHRIVPTTTSASRLPAAVSPAIQRSRGLATVQDAPVHRHGGLQDQDRIFQNLYGRHGADLKTAQKHGDWHKTKEIILKGHDWVCPQLSTIHFRAHH